MALLNCFTWNSQGKFSSTAKENVIKPMTRLGYLGFIQEGGVDTEIKGVQAYKGASAGALNERCTNYILIGSPHILPFEIPTDAEGRVVMSGGQAGRSAVAVLIGRALYVCWHDTASSDNTATANLLRVLDAKYRGWCDDIVIGGDFNTDPSNIQTMLTQRSRPEPGFKFRRVISCGQATHKSDAELDFFVHLSKRDFRTAPAVSKIDVPVSDHDAVQVVW